VLTYTMPFWTLLLARLFLHEQMGLVRWIAVALAAGGLLVLVDPAHLGGLLSSALAVGAGCSWAASIVLVKGRQGRMRASVLALTVWQMLGAALLLFTAAHLFETRPTQWTGGFVVALLYTSLIASTFAWIVFYYALARLPAGLTALGTLATPVIGVLAAWLQLGERPTTAEVVGMTLIGAGLALLAWPTPRPAAEATSAPSTSTSG
jgi:drug/metabolite transporter (DMT)-like permease